MLRSNTEYLSKLVAIDHDVINHMKYDWNAKGGHQFNFVILILASINAGAATLMISSILYEAWSNREWDFFLKTRGYLKYLPIIHTADVFPVIFGTVVIIQSIIFITIYVFEAHSMLSRSCQTIAEFVWPALWIAPYTMLIFGLETTFSSLQRKAFSARSRRHFWICIIAILLLTIITLIPSAVSPIKGECLPTLIWWTFHYARAGVAICLVLIFAYITSASVITFQLLGTPKIDRDQRIQASRIVYYLITSTVVILLILPYYVEVTMMKPAFTTAKMAEVAVNTSGLLPAFFHLFLRSNTDWTIIRAMKKPWWSSKRDLRIFETADMDMYDHMSSPVSLETNQSSELVNDPEKSPIRSPQRPLLPEIQSPLAHFLFPARPTRSEINLPSTIAPTGINVQNRVNYSIFPTHGLALPRESVSTTFSQGEESIEMPKPLFAYSHKRAFSGQSNATSATVQIGLRMSYPGHGHNSTGQAFLGNIRDTSRYSAASGGSFLPVRDTSQVPSWSNNARSDISILPTHSNETRVPSQVPSPRSNQLSPNWMSLKGSNVASNYQQTDGIMKKCLRPDLPGEGTPRHDLQGLPKSPKPAWRSEGAMCQRWI